jgi:hypothetical protein
MLKTYATSQCSRSLTKSMAMTRRAILLSTASIFYTVRPAKARVVTIDIETYTKNDQLRLSHAIRIKDLVEEYIDNLDTELYLLRPQNKYLLYLLSAYDKIANEIEDGDLRYVVKHSLDFIINPDKSCLTNECT